MVKEFRDFVLKGNVVDLAVAVVIGAALGAVIASLVEYMVMPLIALIIGKPDFTSLVFSISGTEFGYGQVLTTLITFLGVAAVVFFAIVRPMTTMLTRLGMGPKEPAPTRTCPECLSDIPAAATRCSACTAQSPATA